MGHITLEDIDVKTDVKTPTRTLRDSLPWTARAGSALVIAALLAVAPASFGDNDPPAAGYDGYDAAYSDEAPAGYDAGYSYVRNLRGSATLVEAGGDPERAEVVLNQPVLAGDRLWVAPGSRVEILLSDGNLLRIDGDSEVTFGRLAMSPESGDRTTELRLSAGNVQLVVFADALGDGAPRIELPNASVYFEEAGAYRVTADRDWSQVVAREGWAEVATARGSVVVRGGEEAIVEGDRAPRPSVRRAGARDDLERWGARLDEQQISGDRLAGYEMDDSLRYAAAPLEEHGTWVTVEHRRAWRPYVDHGWRPYRDGRWRHTPIGLTWVSYEPWGWVPYHYGTWDFSPSFGWVWYPGARFAPAWVYWYWGPSHVAWVPAGYYTHHYSPWYGRGFRHGVYGWAGGSYGIFADWVFCPTVYLGSRHQDRYAWAGRDWQGRDRRDVVPRGIITTDTRGLRPDTWRDQGEVERVLRTRPRAGAEGPGGAGRVVANRGGELPDVTPFVERRRELPKDVERRVVVAEREGGRVAGTPLAPATVRPDRSGGGSGAVVGGRRAAGRPETAGPVLGGGRTDTTGGSPGRTPVAVRGDRADEPGPGAEARPRAEASPRGTGRIGGVRPDRGAEPGPAADRPPARIPVSRTPATGSRPSPERSEPRSVEPERSSPPAADTGAGRGVVAGRPAGAQPTPEGYRSSPRFRDAGASPSAGSPRGTSQPNPPRGVVRGGRTAPPAAQPSPSPSPRADRPSATIAPRGDRGSTSAAPPARRVVRGIRGDSPGSGQTTPPARTAPSRRAAPPTAAPRSPAPSRSSGGGSKAVTGGRSSAGKSGGQASSGGGGGQGRAARVRGKKGDGDNR